MLQNTWELHFIFSSTQRWRTMCTDSPKEEENLLRTLGQTLDHQAPLLTPLQWGSRSCCWGAIAKDPQGTQQTKSPLQRETCSWDSYTMSKRKSQGQQLGAFCIFRETLDSLSYIHPSTCKSIQQQQHPFYPSNVRETGLDEIKQL